MSRFALRFTAVALAAASALAATASAQTSPVTVRSGNASAGIDPDVRVLQLPIGGAPTLFQGTDFAAAVVAPSAYVTQTHPLWKTSLTTDTEAKWDSVIADGAGNEPPSGLYAIAFNLPMQPIGSATMDISVAVDNWLGFSPNEGVFINGIPVSGTQAGPGVGSEVDYLSVDVASMVQPGLNYLYVYAENDGGPGGVMFSATFTVSPPPTWTNLGLALAGSLGDPALAGTGTLESSTPLSLLLGNARPFSSSWLVVGVTAINAPFKGGVMVPDVNLMFALTTDFFGKSSFGGLWPSGIPSGFTTYFQWWIQDPAGPKGFAASNALAGTTP